MNEQIEAIRAEIKRRKKGNMYDELPMTIGRYYEDRDLLSFIDSLPEETAPKGYDEAYLNECIAKASKTWEGVDVDKFMGEVRGRESDDLEEEFEKYLSENIEFDRAGSAMDKWNKGCHLNRNDLEDIAGYFAKWGAEHFRDSTKMINKSLEEAATTYATDTLPLGEGTYVDSCVYRGFIAGAEWQKDQMMKEWLQDRDGCFWDGVNEGKKAMKEQMMKDAVDGEIYGCDGLHWIETDADENIKGKEGDKVRIIIVKED